MGIPDSFATLAHAAVSFIPRPRAPLRHREHPRADAKTECGSNGRAERAVQKVQKKTRVFSVATERIFGVAIAVLHPAFPRLVVHAVEVLNRTELGQDGKTLWERLKTKALL